MRPRLDGTIFGIRNGPSKAGELVVVKFRARAASFVPAAPKHLPIASGCLSIFGYFPLSLFGAEGLRVQGLGLRLSFRPHPNTFPLPPDVSPKGFWRLRAEEYEIYICFQW